MVEQKVRMIQLISQKRRNKWNICRGYDIQEELKTIGLMKLKPDECSFAFANISLFHSASSTTGNKET